MIREKKNYVKPSMVVVALALQGSLLAGSEKNPNDSQVPDMDINGFENYD